MIRPVWLLLAGICAYLVFLSVTAPASLIVRVFDRPPVSVSYTGVEGTVWRGRVDGLTIDDTRLGRLDWRMHPAGLLRAKLTFQVALDGRDTMLRGRFDAGRRSMVVSELDAVAPLWLLARITRYQGPVDADVVATGIALTVRDGAVTGVSGELRVQDLRVTVVERHPLGDYRLALRMDAGDIVAEVRDDSDILSVDGAVRFDPGGTWELDLRVAARDAGRDLRPILDLIGERDADGYHRLAVRGTLE